MDANKQKALEAALKNIEKSFGKEAVMTGGKQIEIDVISTGIISLDVALGAMGLPRGRIIELYGPEGSGKTSLALNMVAQVQKAGGVVSYIDVEQALNPDWVKLLGVDIDKLLISQPESAEASLSIAEQFIRSGAVDLVVIDSVAAMCTNAELGGEIGELQVGLLARIMGQTLRKITSAANETNTMVIFVNQLRDKINTFGWGPKEDTPGGRALKFYASVRLDIRRIGSVKQGEEKIGNKLKVTVVKNKIATPFKKAEFDILFEEGIDKTGNLLDAGVKKGIISKEKSTYFYKGEKLGVGESGVAESLKANPEIVKEILKDIYGNKVLEPQISNTPTEATIDV